MEATSRRARARVRLMMLAMLLVAIPLRSHGDDSATLRGGGSTLVDPVMRKWVAEYRELKGVTVSYASVGSGKGIAGMASGEFDFGCTDAPMSDEDVKEAEKSGRQIVHVPVALAAVAPIYNLPDLKGRMRFSGAVLAGIFLGKIHRWNAPELEALNPTIALPDHEIAVVHRLDSSGTTYVWSEYLAKVSPEWKDTIGVGKTVPWPLGVAAKGNEGVAGQVKQIPASIGYAQLTYALRETLQYGSVQNGEGEFVDPLPAAVTAAAGGISKAVPEDLRFSLTNAPEKSSYPISATTWAVVYARQTAAKGARIADFLRWVVHDGQQFAEGLNYAPLPQPLVERGEARIASISVRNDVGAQAAQAEATP